MAAGPLSPDSTAADATATAAAAVTCSPSSPPRKQQSAYSKLASPEENKLPPSSNPQPDSLPADTNWAGDYTTPSLQRPRQVSAPHPYYRPSCSSATAINTATSFSSSSSCSPTAVHRSDLLPRCAAKSNPQLAAVPAAAAGVNHSNQHSDNWSYADASTATTQSSRLCSINPSNGGDEAGDRGFGVESSTSQSSAMASAAEPQAESAPPAADRPHPPVDATQHRQYQVDSFVRVMPKPSGHYDNHHQVPTHHRETDPVFQPDQECPGHGQSRGIYPGGANNYSASDIFNDNTLVDAIVQPAPGDRNGPVPAITADGSAMPHYHHNNGGGVRHPYDTPAAATPVSAAAESNHQETGVLFEDDWLYDDPYHHQNTNHHSRPDLAGRVAPLSGQYHLNNHYPYNQPSRHIRDPQYQNSPPHQAYQHHDDHRLPARKLSSAQQQQQRSQHLHQHGHPPIIDLGTSPSRYQNSSTRASPPPPPPYALRPRSMSSHYHGSLSAASSHNGADFAPAPHYFKQHYHRGPLSDSEFSDHGNSSSTIKGSPAYPGHYTYPQPTFAENGNAGPAPTTLNVAQNPPPPHPSMTPAFQRFVSQPPLPSSPLFRHLSRPLDRAAVVQEQEQQQIHPHYNPTPYMMSPLPAPHLPSRPQQQQQRQQQQGQRRQIPPERPHVDTSITAPRPGYSAHHVPGGGGGNEFGALLSSSSSSSRALPTPVSLSSAGGGTIDRAAGGGNVAGGWAALASNGHSYAGVRRQEHDGEHGGHGGSAAENGVGGGTAASSREHPQRLQPSPHAPHIAQYGRPLPPPPPSLPHPIPPSPISATSNYGGGAATASVCTPTLATAVVAGHIATSATPQSPQGKYSINNNGNNTTTDDTYHAQNADINVSNPTPPRRERRFACTECPKRFLRRQDLSRHAATHLNGFKPFRCAHCGTGFTRQDALHRHGKAKRCVNNGAAAAAAVVEEMLMMAMPVLDTPPPPATTTTAAANGGGDQPRRRSHMPPFRIEGGQQSHHHEQTIEQQQQQHHNDQQQQQHQIQSHQRHHQYHHHHQPQVQHETQHQRQHPHQHGARLSPHHNPGERYPSVDRLL
ncbi:hypothetical protein HDU86_005304 [Geranomyces michiganensis]|nr:hypothetical protein HDU86_005304 [Geranomyces michiganensis]